MPTAFNKVAFAWTEVDDPAELTPAEDWIVDPVFDDPDGHVDNIGPQDWQYPGDNVIYVPTSAELDVDASELELVKEAKRTEINDLRTAKLYGGYTDPWGVRWNSTAVDIQNLNAVLTLILAGAITNDVDWHDLDNVSHTMTAVNMITLAGGLGVFGQTCYAVSWIHKNNVDALTTISEVEAYDSTTGWPS